MRCQTAHGWGRRLTPDTQDMCVQSALEAFISASVSEQPSPCYACSQHSYAYVHIMSSSMSMSC